MRQGCGDFGLSPRAATVQIRTRSGHSGALRPRRLPWRSRESDANLKSVIAHLGRLLSQAPIRSARSRPIVTAFDLERGVAAKPRSAIEEYDVPSRDASGRC